MDRAPGSALFFFVLDTRRGTSVNRRRVAQVLVIKLTRLLRF